MLTSANATADAIARYKFKICNICREMRKPCTEENHPSSVLCNKKTPWPTKSRLDHHLESAVHIMNERQTSHITRTE